MYYLVLPGIVVAYGLLWPAGQLDDCQIARLSYTHSLRIPRSNNSANSGLLRDDFMSVHVRRPLLLLVYQAGGTGQGQVELN